MRVVVGLSVTGAVSLHDNLVSTQPPILVRNGTHDFCNQAACRLVGSDGHRRILYYLESWVNGWDACNCIFLFALGRILDMYSLPILS